MGFGEVPSFLAQLALNLSDPSPTTQWPYSAISGASVRTGMERKPSPLVVNVCHSAELAACGCLIFTAALRGTCYPHSHFEKTEPQRICSSGRVSGTSMEWVLPEAMKTVPSLRPSLRNLGLVVLMDIVEINSS